MLLWEEVGMTEGIAPPRTIEPAELSAMIRGFGQAKAVMSGIELGVYDALCDGPLTPEELARRLSLPVASLHRLLIYLCSIGLLEKRADAYANTPPTTMYLVSDQPTYMGGNVGHLSHDLYLLWNHLSDAIREDSNRRPQAFPGRDDAMFGAAFHDPVVLRETLSAMTASTTPVANELARYYDFGAHRCLLDVGSAFATLPIIVLTAYPHLRGISFDLPVVGPLAAETIADARLADRLRVASVDMFTDPLPTGADAITLSMILHDWDDERCLLILERCHAALTEGGAVLVIEGLLNDEGTGPERTAWGSLNMLVATNGGRERTAGEYFALLARAGFVRPEVVMLPAPSTRHCVVAWKI